MNDELGSEGQAEMGGTGRPAVLSVAAAAAKSEAVAAKVGKSAKTHFSASLVFLPSFRRASNRGDQSNPVKVNQTDLRKG